MRRPRLNRALNAASSYPITLVTGLAGAGKTSAVHAWATRHPHAVAWLTCADEDRETSTLWHALWFAIERGLALSDQPISAPTPQNAAELTNLLHKHGTELTIVIDDAHLAGDALQSLEPVLRWLPSTVRVIIIARGQPALPIAQLRLRGELAMLDDSDLRFTEKEVTEVLLRLGADVPAETAEQIHTATEGWVAGVTLTATELRGSGAGVIAECRVPAAVDAFVRAEILAGIDDELAAFVLDICVLEHITPAICAAICGDARTATHLPVLTSGVLPIGYRDDHGGLRMHPQIGLVLRDIMCERDPELRASRHSQAARAYEAAGDLPAAVHHYVSAGDVQTGTALVQNVVREGSASAAVATLFAWNRAIDPTHIRTDQSGQAQVLAALASVLGADRASAQSWLERVDWLEQPPGTCVSAQAAVCREALAFAVGTNAPTEPLDLDTLGANGFLWLALACLGRGWAYLWDGDTDGVHDAIATLQGHQQLEGPTEASLLALRAELSIYEGDVREASRLANSAISLLDVNDPTATWAWQDALRARGLANIDRAQYEHAESDLLRARDLNTGRPAMVAATLAGLALTHRAHGQLDAAVEAIPQARALLVADAPLQRHLTAIEVLTDLEIRDLKRARCMLNQLPSTQMRRQVDVRYALVNADADADADAVADALAALPPPVTTREQLDVRLLHAAIAERRGDKDLVHEQLFAAIALAEPVDLVRPFFTDGLGLDTALIRVLRQRQRTQFAQALRHEHGRRQRRTMRTPVRDAPARIAQLTPRERETLELLNSSKSVRVLAEELHLSPNTLRTHIKSLYRKLNVHSRDEALRILAAV